MFEIDTGAQSQTPVPKSLTIDGSIDLTAQPEWAERAHRQIIEAIEQIETTADLKEYWAGESLLLDAFYMNCPEYWERIKEAHDNQRVFVDPENRLPFGNADPAEPGKSLKVF